MERLTFLKSLIAAPFAAKAAILVNATADNEDLPVIQYEVLQQYYDVDHEIDWQIYCGPYDCSDIKP